jgi:hypothetical protein
MNNGTRKPAALEVDGETLSWLLTVKDGEAVRAFMLDPALVSVFLLFDENQELLGVKLIGFKIPSALDPSNQS